MRILGYIKFIKEDKYMDSAEELRDWANKEYDRGNRIKAVKLLRLAYKYAEKQWKAFNRDIKYMW